MLRILIVEDDDELRDSLELLLRQAGHEVLVASSAAAARPLLTSIDLLLTDLRLPDDLGTTLLVDAQKANPRVQAILMTGYATIESAIAATRNGARDYLLKPFEMNLLKRQVAEVDALCAHQRHAARTASGIVGHSAAMKRVLLAIEVTAASSAAVPEKATPTVETLPRLEASELYPWHDSIGAADADTLAPAMPWAPAAPPPARVDMYSEPAPVAKPPVRRLSARPTAGSAVPARAEAATSAVAGSGNDVGSGWLIRD